MEDKEIRFEIVRRFGGLSAPGRTGWTKELNMVAWNGREPKYDIREWSADHSKMGKGLTLSREEALALKDLLADCLA